ncbi:MAG: hypothetical protein UIL37_02920 [Clostridia bacterium]|nr:hypothetical protein [Clostridia bacterium]
MRVRRVFVVFIVFAILISFAGTFFIEKEAAVHRRSMAERASLVPVSAPPGGGEAFRNFRSSYQFLNSAKKTGTALWLDFYFRSYTMQLLRILIYTNVFLFAVYVFFKVILKRAP